jgi:4-aminobutyrate aminotransferase-like enzyme
VGVSGVQRSVKTLVAGEAPSMARTVEREIQLAAMRAAGDHFWDEDDRRQLDMTSGSGVLALGHGDAEVLAAMHAQLDAFAHGGWQVTCPARAALTEDLAAALPWPDPMVLFCTTGSEAVEASLKVARAATGRRSVVGFLGGYHGKTAGALGVTANSGFRAGVTELPLVSLSLPYATADGYVPLGAPVASGHDFGQRILEHPDMGLNDVAALVLETVQGSAGMIAAAPGLLRELREFTRRHDILLVIDEIYTGLGRTGALFSYEHEGVVPDLVVLGKSLGGGIPVSVVAGPAELLRELPSLRQSSTFSANPVACAAAGVVLRRVSETALLERVSSVGQRLAHGLSNLDAPGVDLQVSGRGLMLGLHVLDGPWTSPADAVQAVCADLRERGVLTLRGGSRGDIIKLTPPLTISDDSVEHALEAIEAALRSVMAASRPHRR